MASLTALRQAIGTNIGNNLANISVYSYVPHRFDPPLAVVSVLENLEYDFSMARGSDKFIIPVRLFVSNIDGQDSQETLDAFLNSSGSSSMKVAIESDKTLGGIASTLRVVEARDYGAFELNNVELLGVEFLVEVIA
tara:strand:- start:469 stop:879 length:411 start_codon:yes stop_codon:yes gene_type:complete